jgi:hypothetical protein
MKLICSVNVAGFQEVGVSLIKRLMMTPGKLAANQANARHSHGPATPESLERTWESRVRYGVLLQGARAPAHLRFVTELLMKLKHRAASRWRETPSPPKVAGYPTI